MSFQLNSGIFQQGAAQQSNNRSQLFDSISRGLAMGQRMKEMDMRERQYKAKQEAEANDPKNLADAGMMKAAQGLPMTPQEQAAMKVWQAKQRPVFDPTTQQMLGAPDIFKALNIGGSAPSAPQQAPSSNVFDVIMPQAGGSDATGMEDTPKGKMTRFETNEAIRKKKGEATIEAQKKLDEKFINDVYVPYKTGGFADTKKQLGQIDEVKDTLSKENITGGVKGYLPTWARGAIPAWEKSVDAQEKVEEVVQRNLREVLGAQFTEKEGERLINRAYNPRLSEEVNLKRVEALHQAMSEANEAKVSAIKYYEDNGTLSGWTGNAPTMQSIENRFKELSGDKDDPKSQGDQGYRFKGRSYTQEQIESTARKRGMSVEEVLEKLKGL